MTLSALALAQDTLTDVVLRENETKVLPACLVELADAGEWASLGVSVDRRLGDDSGQWRVRADRLVGVAELGPPASPVRVKVDPKIEADQFLLADWAFGRVRDLLEGAQRLAHIDVVRRDPAACLLAWYLDSLEAFVVRWLRRDFQMRSEVLVGRVRGHISMREYAARHVATGQPHHVPCQFLEASRDTLPNRILRRALGEVAGIIPTLPVPAARQHLKRSVGRIEPFFAGVTSQPIAAADFTRVRLGRSQRHYEPMLRKSEALLSGLLFTQQFGAHRQRAFLWDAGLLFQEALRGVLSSWSDAALDGSRGRAALIDHIGRRRSSSKVDPDYVLRGSHGAFVLDAKWKDVIVGRAATASATYDEQLVSIAPDTRIRICRSDVYQAVSYSRHEQYAPCATGLVYPVALGELAPLPQPMRIVGFGPPVWVLFIDVGHHAAGRFSEFFAAVSAAWSTSAGT